MNVVVTGSDGFIGHELVKKLLSEHNQVTEIDKKKGSNALYIEGLVDWSQNIDCVYHLAAQTSVFNDKTFLILEDNMRTFMSVIESCNKHKVKLVYASSSTANLCNITSMYGISKAFDEMYANIYSYNATGIRFHNVYGKDSRNDTLLGILKTNKTVKLYNNGNNYRHFTYVGDIVDGIIKSTSINSKLVNCYNPEINSVLEFTKQANKYLNFKYELVNEKRSFDKTEQKVDTSIPSIEIDYKNIEENSIEKFIFQ